jgi:branched-chain amino acid transport system permease protein
MNYAIHLLVMIEIYLLLAVSTNILSGFTGLLSFSQAAFYGIGAYVTSLIMVNLGTSFLIGSLCAIFSCITVSLIIFLLSIRLRNLYFSLGSLAFQIIVFGILYNWVSVTKGPYGIAGIPRPTIFGYIINDISSFALFGGIITGLVIFFITQLQNKPLFRLLQCVRDNELGLISAGRNPAYYKLIGITFSSGIAGLAGALYATYFSYIDPTVFSLEESILFLSIILIGGSGNIIGPIVGVLFYILLPEVLKFVSLPDTIAANFRMMIYASILIIIIRYKPSGFFGTVKY